MEFKKKVIVIGAGGHGKSIAEITELIDDYVLVGFLDDQIAVQSEVIGYPILGMIEQAQEFADENTLFFVAVGNNDFRESVHKELASRSLALATIIHPSSIVSRRAKIGEGSAIMAGAVIGCEAEIQKGCIVNCNAVVDHDAVVEAFGHLGVGANMAGGTVLREKAWLHAGASLDYQQVVRAGGAVKAVTKNEQ